MFWCREMLKISYLNIEQGIWCLSVCLCMFALCITYHKTYSSNLLHTWQMYSWEPKEVLCQWWSCLDKRLSRDILKKYLINNLICFFFCLWNQRVEIQTAPPWYCNPQCGRKWYYIRSVNDLQKVNSTTELCTVNYTLYVRSRLSAGCLRHVQKHI